MSRTPSTMLELGTTIPAFSLPDVTNNDKPVSNTDFNGKPVLVAFICNHCPYVRHIIDTFSTLVNDYQKQGVQVVAISSNDIESHPADSPEEMVKFSKENNLNVPYLYDEAQDAAKAYKAACTPDFYLFDDTHRLVYRGQFDESTPNSGIPVTGKSLNEAVTNLLSGKPVSEEQKPSVGCNIKWKQGNEPAYYG